MSVAMGEAQGAFGGEVVRVGLPAVAPGAEMIEFAVAGAAVAGGEAAGLVPGADEVGQAGWGPVGGSAVVEEPAHLVGDQAAPGAVGLGGDAAGHGGGDGAVAGEFGGLVV
jgi:hypothetical protein